MLPALGGGPANETAAGALGEGAVGVAARVVGTVLVTFLAGLVLAGLRAGSGSLLAPIGAHWAVNGAGIVLVHLVAALITNRPAAVHPLWMSQRPGPGPDTAAGAGRAA